ncbi:MAG: UDP-glucose 4-epimerase GalE [Gammaproteobacteria bacterium]|nr:UDP-glucose 4-epimerase GalE [Gammaproteobacteria bacterium]
MENMSVLVTGGAGYIGSHVTLALVESGYQVTIIDNLSTGNVKVIPSECQFIEGNVGDSDLVSNVLRDNGIQSVLHFAGSIIVEESVSDPLKYYRNNTSVSRSLIQSCVDNNVNKFIFSSTAAVYGNPEKVPAVESDPTNPINPYGASKLMTERVLSDVANACDLNFVALRYFNVAGADPQQRTGQIIKNATHLIKVACETALGERESITIFGNDYDTPDGTCIRDYIHVSDLATAHVKALEFLEENKMSKILNCGYGTGYSVSQVLDTLQRITGEKLNIIEGPRRAGDSEEIVADNTLILSNLDWQPQYQDLEKIISDALKWEKLNYPTPA